MRKPLGFIFDLGGTLPELKAADFIAGNTKLLEFAIDNQDLTADDIQNAADLLNRELENIRDESMIEFRVQAFYRLLFETLGLSFTISYTEMAREVWHAGIKYVPADGIFDLLDMLDANQVKVGVLSNSVFSGALLEEELEKHNLAHRFLFVISSADYGFRKPHNRIFQIAINKMNLAPQDIWFAGNKLEYDIKGAIGSGLYPVYYNSLNEPVDDYECLEITDWHELKGKIESLYAQ